MGQQQSNLSESEIASLESSTKFTNSELAELKINFFRKFPDGFMTKKEFIEENISTLGGSPEFWSGIFQQFDQGSKDERLAFHEFLTGLSFMIDSSIEEKLMMIFKMYDLDDNGTLDRSEVKNMAETFLRWNGSAEEGSEVYSELFDEMDVNQDNVASIDDFVSVMKVNPAFHTALERCLRCSLRVATIEDGTQSFGNQVAGHKGEGKGILKDGDNILKSYSQREFDFYSSVESNPAMAQSLSDLIPKFSGRKQLEDDTGKVNYYLSLEDLTHGMKNPNICDLKMGKHTHEPNAPLRKKMEQTTLDNLSTSSQLGFRICGMRTYQVADGSFVVRDKPWGVSVASSEMQRALTSFFNNGQNIRYDVCSRMLPNLRKMLSWFKSQTSYCFIGSSILMIYDGDVSNTEVHVRMIDFAHTISTTKPDEDYIYGLNKLINFLEAIELDGSFKMGPHQFEETSFGKPVHCLYCRNFIWGIAKQGVQCKKCNYPCHRNCQSLVPLSCPEVKKVSDIQPSPRDVNSGSSGDESEAHCFSVVTFPSPYNCSYCKKFIWGVYKQGVQCKACSTPAHKYCAPHMKKDCQGKVTKSKLSKK
eukprot:TRINITY_DN3755_c0_g1_i1.p1 TRINITY_DN3755_c0_g1~~TRINITY_DN3755_c0_g1_i1.p1  ORF type:complete len:600 (-),score=160.41 TRINITY_DN3755_c0_g1_i1:75-1841(-)